MYNYNNTTSNYRVVLSQTNKRIKRGDITNIAQRSGYSRNYTSEVLNGYYNNPGILRVARELVGSRKPITQK